MYYRPNEEIINFDVHLGFVSSRIPSNNLSVYSKFGASNCGSLMKCYVFFDFFLTFSNCTNYFYLFSLFPVRRLTSVCTGINKWIILRVKIMVYIFLTWIKLSVSTKFWRDIVWNSTLVHSKVVPCFTSLFILERSLTVGHQMWMNREEVGFLK